MAPPPKSGWLKPCRLASSERELESEASAREVRHFTCSVCRADGFVQVRLSVAGNPAFIGRNRKPRSALVYTTRNFGPIMSPSERPPVVQFGAFAFDPRARELRKHDRKLKIQGQPLEILALLLERPGEIVTREELQKRLWPEDTFVDFEHSLNAAVKRLRDAMGDSADAPQYVETLARRGYRFIAPVEAQEVPGIHVGGAMLRDPNADGSSADLQQLQGEQNTGQAAVARATPDAPWKRLADRWKLVLSGGIVGVAIVAGAFFYAHRATALTERDTIVLAD